VLVAFVHQSGGAELLDDRTEEDGRDRKIVKVVLMGTVIGIHFCQQFFQLLEGLRAAEVAGEVIHPALEPFFEVRIDLHVGKLLEILLQLRSKVVGRHGVFGDADDCEFLREKVILPQVVQGGNQLAPGEVTRGAENDHDAGIAGASDPFARSI
jgi:hypothetical protein